MTEKKTKEINRIWDILILTGLCITLVVMLVPLLWIARYSFMSADDYSYMYQVGGVFKETHSVIKTFIYEAGQSIETWKTWQGLYFADWLYFVILDFFGSDMYFIGTYIGIFSLITANIALALIVFHKVQGADELKSVVAVLPITMLQILLPPSGMEAFYWLISVILYTFSFSMLVVFSSCMIRIFALKKEEKNAKIIPTIVVAFILAFTLGGSNYVTGLPALSLLLVLCVAGFVFKKKNAVLITIITIWYSICFAFNVLSPGAAIRQSAAGTGDTPFHAVLMSFVEAFKYIKTWTNLPVILVIIALLPLFVSMTGKRKIEFKYPWLLTIISFCVFASMFTPNLYALEIIGMYRVQNMYRFALYLLLMINCWYWTGFIRIRAEKLLAKKNVGKNESDIKKKINPHIIGAIKLAFAGTATLFILLSVYKFYGRTSTSVSAYYSLRENEAQIYYSEWQERLKVYNDDTVTDPEFSTYSRKPYLLYFVDIGPDNTDWINEAYARYYGKNSVNLKQD